MAAIPYYEPGGVQPAKSSFKAVAVTKSDTVNFATIARGLYIGGTGDVVLVNPDFTTCAFSAVPTGTFIPCECVRVNSTSTTATNMVALM